jgi:two-component system, NtrC family, nitrogen regulation sensor histidine kinase NtrY
MQEALKRYWYLGLAILSFVAAAYFENRLLRDKPDKFLVKDFQEKLIQKENKLDEYIKEALPVIFDESFSGDYFYSLHKYNHLIDREGFGLLVYENDSIVYWSDQVISFKDQTDSIGGNGKLAWLPNGIYYSERVRQGNLTLEGLLRIKNNYSHENEYLQNTFQEGFLLPQDYIIKDEKGLNAYSIVDKKGNYLFSVQPYGRVLCTKSQLFFCGFLYLVSLVLLLIFIRAEIKNRENPLFFKLFVLAWILFIFYWAHILFQFPKVFYVLDFFAPDYFAYNVWLPSLGDFMLASLFFFFLALNFGLDFNAGSVFKKPLKKPGIFVFFVMLPLGVFYLCINFLIQILIENSSFNFSLNHITGISAQSAVAYFSIGLLLIGLAFITVKIVELSKTLLSAMKMFIMTLAIIIFLGLGQIVFGLPVSYPILILYLAFVTTLLFFKKDFIRSFTLSQLIILISLFSVYSLFVIYNTVSEKERGFQRHLAYNLVSEHDPAAELLITRINNQIVRDTIIQTLLIPPFNHLEVLDNYIVNKYFGSFFRKYEVKVTTCTGGDSLDLHPDNTRVPCFPYFDERIESEGLQVEGTNFYFLDNMSGRINYFGKYHYPLALGDTIGVNIYIDLISSVVSEGIGYPELLMDKSMKKPDIYEQFHYAKYINGELVDQHGDLMYNKYISTYDPGNEEFSFKNWDGYEHLIYHIKDNNYVIVSRDIYGPVEYLISFPYIFVFFFTQVLIFVLAGNATFRKRSWTFDLRYKVQASIISIIFLSLIIVAFGTLFYNVDAYKSKHREDLNEKMKAVAGEIDIIKDRIENHTPDNTEWLYNELIKLSNIFKSDINIYGTNGILIASSRPEIYEDSLISDKMNADAYFELYSKYETNFFQPEKIGKLSYLSAYEPIFSDTGKYLGFINLPYFTRQDKYSQEITTFIVAFINLYVILFLASVIVAVFISNQITKPLTLIRENLRKMKLGKKSDPIDYSRNDEIGNLVKEYNKKVDELAASAELLARSERESAWREMAKQIAHEIKNPLTPMKLNIQYLQRLKNSPAELVDNIEKVSKLLIEQIDNLSSIATEFSNFAKMPQARNQIFDLSLQLQKAIDLFESHEKTNIRIEIINLEEIFVNIDREQFSRAIINLVKNAIQAIPSGKDGIINISLSKNEGKALIKIEDNGTGIPEELQDKLFSPSFSFTTKTSGMGLGLLIVKNIVDNFNGRIWFNTTPGQGTAFFIEIPVYENASGEEVVSED